MRDPTPCPGDGGGRGSMMLILMNVRNPGMTTPNQRISVGRNADRGDDSTTMEANNAAAAITPEKDGRDADDGGRGHSRSPDGDDGAEEKTTGEAAHGGVTRPAVANTSALDLLFPPPSSSPSSSRCEEEEGGCTADGLPTSRPCVVSLPDPSAAAGENDANSDHRQYIYLPRHSRGGDIYEVQHLRNPTSPTGPGGTAKSYGSFLLNSSGLVVSDGKFALVSRVDPLFFALSILGGGHSKVEEGRKFKWMPLDQILAELPAPVRMALANSPPKSDGDDTSPPPATTYSQLDNILESTDQLGDDFLLYKFSPDRATKWLKEKHRRTVRAMQSRLLKRRREEEGRRQAMGGGAAGGSQKNGAFSDSFTLPEDGEEDHEDDTDNAGPEPNADATTESPDKVKGGEATMTTTTPVPEKAGKVLDEGEERAAAVGALQLVCGYLPSNWASKLASAVGLSESDVDATSSDGKRKGKDEKNRSEKKSKPGAWGGGGGDGEADKLLQYTLGVDGNGGGAGDATAALIGDDEDETKTKKRKAGTGPQSFGLKKLAKVNTKGMKSLSSFFGGGGGGSKKKKQKVVTPCGGGGNGRKGKL